MSVQVIERLATALHVIVTDTLESDDLTSIRKALSQADRRIPIVVEFRGTRGCAPSQLVELVKLVQTRGAAYELTGLPGACRKLLDDMKEPRSGRNSEIARDSEEGGA